MRVAIIGSRGIPARWGGWEVFSEGVAAGLVERGHEVTVYCRSAYAEPERRREYRGARLLYLPHLPGKLLETPSHEFLSALHSLFLPFDIYYVLGCRTSWSYILHRVLGKRVIFQTDGVDWERRKWGFFSRMYLRLSYRIAFRLASCVASDSEAVCEFLTRKFGVDCVYLTCGIETSAAAPRAILQDYNLSPGSYFLVVCRIEPENSVDVIVRAFRELSTDKKLVVVGGVNYRSRYFARLRAANDPRVVFTGPVYKEGHVDALLHDCYAYIDGHEVGGTSPGLLRAMAMGCCVLVLDKPFNAEVVGDSGLLWRRDEADLRGVMQSLLARPSLAEEYGAKAVARVRESYSWPTAIDAHERCFARLLTQP